jgi:hypothetical protein
MLSNISQKTRMRIHYSLLPEGFVTATCVGSSAKQLLECLLARKADLDFHYLKDLAKSAERQPADAWILGAKYTTGLMPIADICLSHQDKKPPESQRTTEQEEAQKRTEELLIKAKSKQTDELIAAVSKLLSQAISTYAILKGEVVNDTGSLEGIFRSVNSERI